MIYHSLVDENHYKKDPTSGKLTKDDFDSQLLKVKAESKLNDAATKLSIAGIESFKEDEKKEKIRKLDPKIRNNDEFIAKSIGDFNEVRRGNNKAFQGLEKVVFSEHDDVYCQRMVMGPNGRSLDIKQVQEVMESSSRPRNTFD